MVKTEDTLIEEVEQVDQGMDSFFESKPVSKEAVVVTSGEKEMNKQNLLDEKGKEDSAWVWVKVDRKCTTVLATLALLACQMSRMSELHMA